MQNAIFKYPSDISNETGVLSRAHYRSFCSRPRIIPCESRKKEKKNQTKKKTICIIFPQLAMFLLNKRKKIFSDNKITKNIS